MYRIKPIDHVGEDNLPQPEFCESPIVLMVFMVIYRLDAPTPAVPNHSVFGARLLQTETLLQPRLVARSAFQCPLKTSKNRLSRVYLFEFLYSFLLDLFKLCMYLIKFLYKLIVSTCYISKVWSFTHGDNPFFPSCVGKKRPCNFRLCIFNQMNSYLTN